MIATALLVGLTATLDVVGGAPRALADDWTGTISSARLKNIPKNATYDVRIYDDTEENLRFRGQFLAALSDAGYATGRDAQLVFSFDPELTRSEPSRRGPGDRKADLSGASQFEQRGPRVGLTTDEWLFGNRKRWVVRKSRTRRPPLPDRLHLIVRLRSKESGTVLWSADLYCDILDFDRERIVRSIIGPIIERLGRTRSVEKFSIK